MQQHLPFTLFPQRCPLSRLCRHRSFASGQLPVHWVIHFDPRGEQSLRYRCKNVNLVEKAHRAEDELEFLFEPCDLPLKSHLLPSNPFFPRADTPFLV